jgi:hypothetical protein
VSRGLAGTGGEPPAGRRHRSGLRGGGSRMMPGEMTTRTTDYGALRCPECGNRRDRHVRGTPCPPTRPGYPDPQSWPHLARRARPSEVKYLVPGWTRLADVTTNSSRN